MTRPVVLITGALTGIGRATALAFAKAGANVFVAGVGAKDGERLKKEIAALSSTIAMVNLWNRINHARN